MLGCAVPLTVLVRPDGGRTSGTRTREWLVVDAASRGACACAPRAGAQDACGWPALRAAASAGAWRGSRCVVVETCADVAVLLFGLYSDAVLRRAFVLRGVVAVAGTDGGSRSSAEAAALADHVVAGSRARRGRFRAGSVALLRCRQRAPVPRDELQALMAQLGTLGDAVLRVSGRVAVDDRPGEQVVVQGALGAFAPARWRDCTGAAGALRVAVPATEEATVRRILASHAAWSMAEQRDA
jgi:hypothetical protein